MRTTVEPPRTPTPLRQRADQIAAGIWLLPLFGVLMLWATIEHQPDPSNEFRSWAEFVTTDRFLAGHIIGSIIGQSINILGAAALATVLLSRSTRVSATIAGFTVTVIGSAELLAGFGVAAFAQPAIGQLELQNNPGAHALYDDVYAAPALVTLIGGTLLFSTGSVLLARAAGGLSNTPRWAVLAYGASGPLIGILGIVIAPMQTLGSLAAIVGGTGLARTLLQRDEQPYRRSHRQRHR